MIHIAENKRWITFCFSNFVLAAKTCILVLKQIKVFMDWISVGDKIPQEEDGSYQLVVYLSSFFGVFKQEITLAYFDGPNNYENPESDEGWKDWYTESKILVTHWMRLPDFPESKFDGMSQLDFKNKFGSFRPNLGSVFESKPDE